MANRKPAYRKRRHNKMGIFLVTFCIVMIFIVVAFGSIGLRNKQKMYSEQEALLDEQIAEEMLRTEELKEYETYTKTNAFVEEIAKEKLGLVYEDEILFRSK